MACLDHRFPRAIWVNPEVGEKVVEESLGVFFTQWKAFISLFPVFDVLGISVLGGVEVVVFAHRGELVRYVIFSHF